MNQIIELMEKLNPWWIGKDFDSGILREKYTKKIKSYLKANEIVILNGVRRSGKTTLLFQIIKDLIKQGVNPKAILFVNFDHADLSHLENPFKEVLDVYFQEIAPDKRCYLIFDEVQNVKGWEKWAKSLYDEKKHQIILTGSSSQLLDNKLATLISGRYLKIEVFPLDFREFLEFKNIVIENNLDLVSKKNKILKELKKLLFSGGFPKVVLEEDLSLKEETLKIYYETIIYKEILSIHDIRQKKLMKELLYYLISNFTSLYSYKNLAKLLSADFSTIKEYFGFIEESKAFFSLSFFSYSLKVQNRNNKKIYYIDNGLRNAVSFKFSRDEGKLVENMVFVELKRREKEVYYWQNSKKQEVDFVIKNKDDSLSAINVSYTNEINEREFKGLVKFKNEFKKCKELIILTKDLEKKEKGIKFIPLWKWLLI
ncbi:MAG: ATP-binding protein [Nanoarchaeota archaeon]|nr:ATP-binding protein [Nanoarchaeota archaeon]